MATTFTLIEAKTLSSNAATVSFTSIPATYTDLKMMALVRTTRSAVEENMYLYCNSNDSGVGKFLYGQNSVTDSFSAGDSYKLDVNGANATANSFSPVSFYICNYAKTTQPKNIGVFAGRETNTAADGRVWLNSALWADNAAVSSINMRLQFANFVSGCQFYLYGISNA